MLAVLPAEIQPGLRRGQIVVDHATIGPPDARRLAAEFSAAGAVYLDVAISGGSARARAGTLRMFAGGDEQAFRRVLPHLRVMADPDKIIYGGGPGRGQVIKVMQQLQGRLLNMARMEIIAYGRHQGFDFDEILRILDLDRDSDDGFVAMVKGIETGDDELTTCLYPEWKYYLAEAREKGIPMPMLEGADAFFSRGDKIHRDIIGRPSVSLWRELMRAGPNPAPG
jgi:3-hydroxyisobutyrate dehydrogenase-like beta-hydroxyacid dehydrogenase